MLVTMASEKVQEPAVPRYPPEMLRFALSRPEIGLNVKVEPTPQEPIAGVILAVAMKLGNVLLNVMSASARRRARIGNRVFERGGVASCDG